MTHHLYPFSDERSYFFDSMYDHNRLCHGSKTFFRQPNKDQVQLESMFTKIQVLLSVTLGAEVHSVLQGNYFKTASYQNSSLHVNQINMSVGRFF